MEYKEVIELIRYCQYNGDCEKCKLYLPRENICMDAHDIVTHSVILEHYDKYRWHNLKEDPEDLPEMFYNERLDVWDSDYIEFVYSNNDLPIIGYFRKENEKVFGYDEPWIYHDIIAWRYIEVV